MYVIIGRDANTSQLDITIGQKVERLGAVGCVPNTVSRKHCLIDVCDNGTWIIESLKDENSTFVNGLSVKKKILNKNDKVSLGIDKFPLDLKAISEIVYRIIPKTADIRPLKKVWENYEEESLKQVIAERRFNALRGATGIVTMVAIVLAMFLGHNIYYLAAYCFAIFLVLAFTIKAYRDSTRNPLQKKKMASDFRKQYVCPNCGHHFTMNYDELSVYDSCPWCKAKFIK